MLSLQLEQAKKDRDLIGIRMARGTKDINHTQFVDDTILLGGAIHHIGRRLKSELDSYCQAYGSKLNLRKCSIYSWNINPREMYRISRILGFEGTTTWNSFKYLGVPILKNKQKTFDWSPLIEKFKKKSLPTEWLG